MCVQKLGLLTLGAAELQVRFEEGMKVANVPGTTGEVSGTVRSHLLGWMLADGRGLHSLRPESKGAEDILLLAEGSHYGVDHTLPVVQLCLEESIAGVGGKGLLVVPLGDRVLHKGLPLKGLLGAHMIQLVDRVVAAGVH